MMMTNTFKLSASVDININRLVVYCSTETKTGSSHAKGSDGRRVAITIAL
jgi:hypothetical protein